MSGPHLPRAARRLCGKRNHEWPVYISRGRPLFIKLSTSNARVALQLEWRCRRVCALDKQTLGAYDRLFLNNSIVFHSDIVGRISRRLAGRGRGPRFEFPIVL